MTARRARLILQSRCGVLVAALLVSAQMAAAQGTPTDVCVYLTGSGGKVSGLQMDLGWDPGCMTANSASGTAADCSSNASTGKNVQTRIFPDNATMRVLFLSVSDKSAIPDDTELFCCKFTMVGSQTGSCCSVATSSIIFAGPTGSRVYDASAQLSVVVGGGAPCVSSSAGGSPSNPVRPPAAAIVQPPVVSAPGGVAPAAPAPAAPAPLAPVMPRPNIPAQVPPVQGLPVEAPTPELAPAAAVPSPVVTPAAVKTSTAVQTAAPTTPRTPAPSTPTAPQPTPKVQGTPTGPVPSVAVKVQSATPPATTPTPKRKHKRHKKRGHAPRK